VKENKLSFLPWLITGIFLAVSAASLRAPSTDSLFDINGFARLPVLNGGRLKPLDSVARSALLEISGKQTVRDGDGRKSAIEWLLDVLYNPAKADAYKVFNIDDPDVLGLMGIEQSNSRWFSFRELEPHLSDIDAQATKAADLKSADRSRFQRSILNLNNQLILYRRLENTLQVAGDDHFIDELAHFESVLLPVLHTHISNGSIPKDTLKMLAAHLEQYKFMDRVGAFFPAPTHIAEKGVDGWVSLGAAIMDRRAGTTFHPSVLSYAAMGDALRAADPLVFNQALARYQQWLRQNTPDVVAHMKREALFNSAQPFYQSMIMYVVVFMLAVASWLVWPKTLARAAFWLLVLSFAVHTVGLVSRMLIQGRPPVTNLYSSAVFVGWAAVLLGIVLERLFRRGIGSAVAATIGFVTLIIAHHLAAQGDTLEMMRAVLDSNMWLATHVVCITIGYSSTFLSGFLAVLFILRERFDPHWTQEAASTLERMVYGVICFNVFFSFVGTILGGIWADQSWGRFWGWDPKENGALMIVLWNVFILHARWGGYAKRRGVMALAVAGNIVTSLSWFGVNMLGIGLHSYGFMDKTFSWLVGFAALQLVFIAMAYWPTRTR
jgi:ABC-type transport system involved in cytochrome c biogenesis permease subunit